MDIMPTDGIKNEVVEKWEPVLEGIGSDYGEELRLISSKIRPNQSYLKSYKKQLILVVHKLPLVA